MATRQEDGYEYTYLKREDTLFERGWTMEASIVAVHLIECKGLGFGGFGQMDPFATIEVEDKKEKSMQLMNTTIPKWNQTFNFTVVDMANSEVVIKVYNAKIVGTIKLGEFRIKLSCLTDKIKHEEWVESCYEKANAKADKASAQRAQCRVAVYVKEDPKKGHLVKMPKQQEQPQQQQQQTAQEAPQPAPPVQQQQPVPVQQQQPVEQQQVAPQQHPPQQHYSAPPPQPQPQVPPQQFAAAGVEVPPEADSVPPALAHTLSDSSASFASSPQGTDASIGGNNAPQQQQQQSRLASFRGAVQAVQFANRMGAPIGQHNNSTGNFNQQPNASSANFNQVPNTSSGNFNQPQHQQYPAPQQHQQHQQQYPPVNYNMQHQQSMSGYPHPPQQPQHQQHQPQQPQQYPPSAMGGQPLGGSATGYPAAQGMGFQQPQHQHQQHQPQHHQPAPALYGGNRPASNSVHYQPTQQPKPVYGAPSYANGTPNGDLPPQLGAGGNMAL